MAGGDAPTPETSVVLGLRWRLENSSIGGLIAGTRVVEAIPTSTATASKDVESDVRRATRQSRLGLRGALFWVPGNGDNPAPERRTRRRPRDDPRARLPGLANRVRRLVGGRVGEGDDKKVWDDISQGAGNVCQRAIVLSIV